MKYKLTYLTFSESLFLDSRLNLLIACSCSEEKKTAYTYTKLLPLPLPFQQGPLHKTPPLSVRTSTQNSSPCPSPFSEDLYTKLLPLPLPFQRGPLHKTPPLAPPLSARTSTQNSSPCPSPFSEDLYTKLLPLPLSFQLGPLRTLRGSFKVFLELLQVSKVIADKLREQLNDCVLQLRTQHLLTGV